MEGSRQAALFFALDGYIRLGRLGYCPLLDFIVEERTELHKAFAIQTEVGQVDLVAWFYVHGIREFDLFSIVDEWVVHALDENSDRVPRFDGNNPCADITWLMYFVWHCNEDLRAGFDLMEPLGQRRFISWFFVEGVAKFGLAPLLADRWREWLFERDESESEVDGGVPRFALMFRDVREDLQNVFDVTAANGRAALARWARESAAVDPGLRRFLDWARRDVKEKVEADEGAAGRVGARRRKADDTRPFGVNLIGFAFGELGIGEDVRMAAAACEMAGIPFSVVNIHPGDRLRQGDRILANHVEGQGEEAPYAINLFCLTGFDTARVYLEKGPALFEGRYNIGWWPWELPVWPHAWGVAFDLVDEVWAATEYTHATFSRAWRVHASAAGRDPGPVVSMSLPVDVSRAVRCSRRHLGIPRGFLFLYVFDFNSYLDRKNPWAVVQAFRRAFPARDRRVGLVLKTMNSDPDDSVWRRFLALCGEDARIKVLQRTLDRGEVLGLIDACNAYVSLHRAEGFGRTLAEAMLFGKPVVATDFSGNRDFLTEETGFPVKWTRRSVAEGEYPFVVEADRPWWAEPDIAHAAEQMRRARDQAGDRSFARGVKRYAQGQFSPLRIGAVMRQRLRAVYDRAISESSADAVGPRLPGICDDGSP